MEAPGGQCSAVCWQWRLVVVARIAAVAAAAAAAGVESWEPMRTRASWRSGCSCCFADWRWGSCRWRPAVAADWACTRCRCLCCAWWLWRRRRLCSESSGCSSSTGSSRSRSCTCWTCCAAAAAAAAAAGRRIEVVAVAAFVVVAVVAGVAVAWDRSRRARLVCAAASWTRRAGRPCARTTRAWVAPRWSDSCSSRSCSCSARRPPWWSARTTPPVSSLDSPFSILSLSLSHTWLGSLSRAVSRRFVAREEYSARWMTTKKSVLHFMELEQCGERLCF